MTTISQLGTFDVENYGDLLYPLVFRHVVREREAGLDVRAYSPLPGRAPQCAGFVTRPVRELFEAGPEAESRLVVGGGDILRTDAEVVAAHYGRAYRGRPGRAARSLGAAGSVGYLLLKGLPAPRAADFRARQFRRRWMGYPAAGPFIIDPGRLRAGGAVCYLSCGVPHDFAPAERAEVARAFERARFVYLRDEQSAEKLRRCGVRRETHVAPDLVVALSELFDRAEQAARGRALLAKLGVSPGSPVVCFQSQPYPGFSVEEIARQLERYRRPAGAEVVLLPLGFCHGDQDFIRLVAAASGGAFKYVDAYSVFDAVSVIAASELFVGTSLHGNITAFSFGIPHLLGPLPVDKAEGFLRAASLPPSLKLGSWAGLGAGMESAAGLGPDFFAARAREAKAKVLRVVGELLDALLR